MLLERCDDGFCTQCGWGIETVLICALCARAFAVRGTLLWSPLELSHVVGNKVYPVEAYRHLYNQHNRRLTPDLLMVPQ